MSESPERHGLEESMLIEYITKDLVPDPGSQAITRDTKLIESGVLDSLSILKLTIFLEEKFNVKVAPDEVVSDNFETVGTILDYLHGKRR